MTDDPDNKNHADSAEAAMNEVLAAEQAAANAIEECKRSAQAILHEAGQRARRITMRTDERLALIYQRTSQQLQQRLRRDARREKAADKTGEEDSRDARIAKAVTDLAARLTGGNVPD